MTDENLKMMASQPSNMTQWLKPLLRERVSGTSGNMEVRQFLVSELKKAGFSVSDEPFQMNTPKGPITFANVLGLSGTGHRRLLLTAHYDSKDIPNFIGAIDSAASCAILLEIVHFLSSKLENNLSTRSLQVIFFDGEEAFVEWTAQDSLYGSRHLAEKWEQTFIMSDNGKSGNILSMIDLFILLDLLGSKGSLMYNTHSETAWAWDALVDIQTRLKGLGLIQNDHLVAGTVYPYAHQGIDDDHRPFRERNVSIVHMIPQPFPPVWHTLNDNESALDMQTIQELSLILKTFVIEYLGL